MSTPVNDGNYYSETAEEIKERQAAREPIEADDYILKVAKITLDMQPTWNQAIKQFDYTKKSLSYSLILLPYKLKVEEDPMRDVSGKEVPPLSRWIWRRMNPFSIAMTKDGDPSYLRGFTAGVNGESPALESRVSVPDIAVMHKDTEILVDNATAEQYKAALIKLKKGEITPADFEPFKSKYKHCWDVRSFEGKYVGGRIAVDAKGRNNLVNFSKVPKAFKPDPAVEKEAMEKFEKAYSEMMKSRKEEEDGAATEKAPAEKIAAVEDDLSGNEKLDF